METVLDALPNQPLTAEDVAVLNDAATVKLIPYTWYGEQVVAVLLLHDKRRASGDESGEISTPGGDFDPDAQAATEQTATDTADSQTDDSGSSASGFGTRDTDTVGTVEVIGGDSLAPEETDDEPEEANDTESESGGSNGSGAAEDTPEDLHVYAAGYDDTEAAWVAIAEIDPDAEFTDAEPLIREWISDAYHDQIVDKLAVGPSEYELDDTGE